MSDRIAAHGWRVVAPDLFDGASRLGSLFALPARLARCEGRVFDIAAEAIGEESQRGPSAVIGLSLGAAVALRLPLQVPVVAAYGHVPRGIRATGPILGVYGTGDPLVARSGRRLQLHPHADVRWFEGAGHSFLVDPEVGLPMRLPGFGPHPAAELAWSDIVAFLDHHFGDPVENALTRATRNGPKV